MIGRHLDRELGSERAVVNSVFHQQLQRNTTLKRSTLRKLTRLQLAVE